MKPTLMQCARKICVMRGISQNDVTEIYFVRRKAIHQDYEITGIVLKTDIQIIIVPDINDCEYILEYAGENMKPANMVRDLIYVQEFSQRDVAYFLRYSQSAVSRIKNIKLTRRR